MNSRDNSSLCLQMSGQVHETIAHSSIGARNGDIAHIVVCEEHAHILFICLVGKITNVQTAADCIISIDTGLRDARLRLLSEMMVSDPSMILLSRLAIVYVLRAEVDLESGRRT